MDCHILNPFRAVDCGSNMPVHPETYAIAAGLALRTYGDKVIPAGVS